MDSTVPSLDVHHLHGDGDRHFHCLGAEGTHCLGVLRAAAPARAAPVQRAVPVRVAVCGEMAELAPQPSGRGRAFCIIVKDFRDFVFAATPELSRTAYLLTGDHHLAQDLLQSALANTYRHWGRIWDGNPTAYVRKAMHRERLTWWRRKRVPENLRAQPPERPAPDFAEQAS